MRHTATRFLPVILLASTVLSARPAAALQSDAPFDLAREHVRAVRELYGAASWSRGAPRQGIPLAALTLEGWAGEELRTHSGLLQRSFAANDGAPAFVVEAIVAEDAARAHDALVDWLAGLTSVRKMPAASEWGLSVGDAGFVGPSGADPRALAWVAFARGNVAVRILAVDPRRTPAVDLGAIAEDVDAAILARELLPAGQKPLVPVIDRLVASRSEVTAGERVALDLHVVDPYGGKVHVEWVVGGPGQGYVEAAADGTLHLHTTGPGSLTLTAEVTGSTGTFATRSLQIAVADR